MTIWPMLSSHWIPKATNTDSKYVIHISFILQQWLHQRPQCYVIRALPVLFIPGYYNRNRHFQCCIENKLLMI